MPVVVAFVSQKGGVGKSTLARGLGALVAYAGQKVRIADLDPAQHTVVQWGKKRRESSVTPKVDIRDYATTAKAVDDGSDVELLILDAPGRADATTLEIANRAHLIVQPTGPSLDDLYPAVVLFHELVAAGIGPAHLAFALCRTLNRTEEEDARKYLEQSGYTVLPGALRENPGYRHAQNCGRAITETSDKNLNERADALMLELLSRVAAKVKALRQRTAQQKKIGGGPS